MSKASDTDSSVYPNYKGQQGQMVTLTYAANQVGHLGPEDERKIVRHC